MTEGYVSQDSIHIAGMEIKGQIFEEATLWHTCITTRDDLFDTALGLSLFPTRHGDWPDDLSTSSPFHNMIQQQLLDENIIVLKLPRNDNETGEMVLGGLPSDLRREELVEIPLDHSKTDQSDFFWRLYTMNGWQIPVMSMSTAFNGSNASTPVLEEPQIAVVSSSFPWIGLPDETTKKIHKAIGIRQGFDWINCDERSKLPDWTTAFGPDGRTITLTPWDYLIEMEDKYHKQIKCVSAFYPLEDFGGKGFIILGALYLNGLNSVFDADRWSISFGNRAL